MMLTYVKNFFQKVFGFLFLTNKAWKDAAKEKKTGRKVFTEYALPLILLSGMADIFSLYTGDPAFAGLSKGLIIYLLSVAGDVISLLAAAWLLFRFSNNYLSDGNLPDFVKILSYSITPFALTAMVVKLFPDLKLFTLLGFYSFYVYIRGVNTLFDIPEEKKMAFHMVSVLLIIVSFSFIGMLLNLTVFGAIRT